MKIQWSMNRKIRTLTAIGLCYVILTGWLLSSIWLSGYHQVRQDYGNRLTSLSFCTDVRQDIMEVHLLISNAISSGRLEPDTERSIKLLDERIRQAMVYSQNNALKAGERKQLDVLYGKYRDYQERWRETRSYIELGYAVEPDSRLWFNADAKELMSGMEVFISDLEKSIDDMDSESEFIVEQGLRLFMLITIILCAVMIHVAWQFIKDTKSAVDVVESKINRFLERSGIPPVELGNEDELYKIQEAIDELITAQDRMIHKERLSALGEMAGGIAHNLKTPLMAISANTAIMKRLMMRLESTKPDDAEMDAVVHRIHEILDKLPSLVAYSDRIVDTLLSQTKGSRHDEMDSFTCGQVISQLRVLLEHESRKNGIELEFGCGICKDVAIPGPMDALVQVLCNLAVNAMHAYNGKTGSVVVDFDAYETNVVVSVQDFGTGIAADVMEKVLKQVITTKGNRGTGLGLYISNLIIKGAFNGTIAIASEVGRGTRVEVVLPRYS